MSLIQIHLAVLLFSVSGLYAKLLSLPPMAIVLGRVVFSSLFLFCALKCFRTGFRLKRKRHLLILCLLGGLLAVHWTAFYQSIQQSTVAVGLLTFSTFPVFAAFLEPLFFREKLSRRDLLTALTAFAGIALVVPGFQWQSEATQGALLGVFAGFTYAVLSLMNRKYVAEYSSLLISFYEQFAAALVLLPFFLLSPPAVTGKDLLLLMLLGIVFTGIAHSLFIAGLKRVRTRTAGVISCLEPVYGIFLAWALLGETPSIKELAGGAVVLSSVFYATLRQRKAALSS